MGKDLWRGIAMQLEVKKKLDAFPPGGTYLEKGYRDVRPLRPPCHALLAVP